MTKLRAAESFVDLVERKRGARMAAVDALPPELRELVHEYGYTTVKTLLDHKVCRPKAIRHIVETILDEFSPTRGSFSIQGVRKNVHTGETYK